jgi:hypothetical protein
MSKRAKKAASDPTAAFRRNAFWLYPGVFLFHSLLIYGIYRPMLEASLAAAGAAFLIGIAVRWIRGATTVLALATLLMAFLLLYLIGILSPIAYLVISKHTEWTAWSVGGSTLLILVTWIWRFRRSLQVEWTKPMEKAPGVVLNLETETLVRYPVDHQNSFLSVAGMTSLVVLAMLYFLAGTASRTLVAMLVAPAFVAFLGADVVARMATYLWVARRWEIEHGVRLKLLPLR